MTSATEMRVFPAIVISQPGGKKVSLPCEPINDYFAITPALADGLRFYGGFAITHIPTGCGFTRGAVCIECARRGAAVLLGLDVDWSTLEYGNTNEWRAGLTDAQRQAVNDLINLDGKCDATNCWSAAS